MESTQFSPYDFNFAARNLLNLQEESALKIKILETRLSERIAVYEIPYIKLNINDLICNIQFLANKINEIVTQHLLLVCDGNLKLKREKIFETAFKALQKLDYIFNSDRFHGKCFKSRAMGLLENQPFGAYLLRCDDISFIVSLKMQSIIEYHFNIKGDGTCFDSIHAESVPLDNYISQKLGGKHFYPLAHRPMHQLLAQLEYNLCGATVMQMLKKISYGDCFLTKHNGRFQLYRKEQNGMLSSYSIAVDEKSLTFIGEKRQGKANSLNSLLETIFHSQDYQMVYHLPCKLDLIENFCFRYIFPRLEQTGEPFAKFSRQQLRQLPCSLFTFIDSEGKLQIYKQKHRSPFKTSNGEAVSGGVKGFKGKGSFKTVWSLDPFYEGSQIPMVRARFYNHSNIECKEIIQKIKQLKQDVKDHTHLLIPLSIMVQRGLQETCIQIMPLMEGKDLYKAIKNEEISMIDGLRAVLHAGLGLKAMHEMQWVHRDFKCTNIFLGRTTKLADLDLICKVRWDERVLATKGTPLYTDPAVLIRNFFGLDGGLLNDQFGFGASLFFVCTGEELRQNARDLKELENWVTIDDFYAAPMYAHLDPNLQEIIEGCCFGARSERYYKLPLYLDTLSQVIFQLSQF